MVKLLRGKKHFVKGNWPVWIFNHCKCVVKITSSTTVITYCSKIIHCVSCRNPTNSTFLNMFLLSRRINLVFFFSSLSLLLYLQSYHIHQSLSSVLNFLKDFSWEALKVCVKLLKLLSVTAWPALSIGIS